MKRDALEKAENENNRDAGREQEKAHMRPKATLQAYGLQGQLTKVLQRMPRCSRCEEHANCSATDPIRGGSNADDSCEGDSTYLTRDVPSGYGVY